MVTRRWSVGRNACSKPAFKLLRRPVLAAGRASDASARLARQRGYPLRHGLGPGDPGFSRRHRENDELRHLRLGPALFHNFVPAMLPGDIMGHEMVVEVGSALNGNLKVGDRVVVPFTIICGECEQCNRPRHRWSVRLHPPSRRFSRRPGRVSACAICRQDAHKGP